MNKVNVASKFRENKEIKSRCRGKQERDEWRMFLIYVCKLLLRKREKNNKTKNTKKKNLPTCSI